MIHSLTPAIVLYLLSIVGKVFRLEDRWNVGKEAILIFFFFLIVGLIQFLIRDIIYDNANNWSWDYLFEEIRNTFLVGLLFITILIPINFARLNTKNTNSANTLNNNIKNNPHVIKRANNNIKINDLELDINQFMFAKSEGNYLEIYLYKRNPNKVLIRTTLKNVETLLKTYPNIIKTHRSYLVNYNYIEKINGNAQGYQLHINKYIVPVSRNMITNFNLSMKRL
ncbi:LytTR family DNA-binding domain-containing protein [Galbibacter sp. EGI 63066]|uniref:LytTR family DNA-binding domain-containing protein n=1 Tax=Galbibacter sp. EGI 63066 TaxID=2993559 RepID=UPI002248DD29|nr:LytTR family DNA-binding domain-containing protein [Galbibacter sp. EGI 63066]MCX2680485.1 LytTR family DNA-binding domain-containing protein [Galbibacter sp. EGI 63066]